MPTCDLSYVIPQIDQPWTQAGVTRFTNVNFGVKPVTRRTVEM